MRLKQFWLATTALTVGFAIVWPVRAGPTEESIDAALVGRLNMATTDFPTQGCAPTSVTNSFAYLQAQYPAYYGTSLIPTDSSLKAVANTLGGADYMKTNESGDGNKGTYYSNLVIGKQKYLNDKAITTPGVNSTTVTGQSDPDNPWPPGDIDSKPPGFSTDHAPTAAFILQALHDKKDVEVLIESPEGHYVTVTRMMWDPDTQKGSIDYVDPIGGTLKTNVPLSAYTNGDPIFAGDGEISMVVAEGPANLPEPGVAGVCFTALVVGFRRSSRNF